MDIQSQHAATLLAAEWGWTNPTREILSIVEESLFAQANMSGEIVVRWGLIDAATRDRLLKAKPSGVRTLEYFADQEPLRIRSYVEKILALKNGYPYYSQLSLLMAHPSMNEAGVIKRCEELDAVVMTIDGVRAVLVFAKWDSLLKYSTAGSTVQTDALYKACGGEMPLLAVGDRNDITSVLKSYHSNAGEQWADAGTKVWYTEAEELQTPEAKEIARLIDHTLAIGGTDIAFKPFRNGSAQVLIRKLGRLVNPFRDKDRDKDDIRIVYPADIALKAINLLMQHSGANPKGTKLREPSDGQITYKSTAADAFLRLNFLPLNHIGELKELRSVSIRVFGRTEQSLRLTDINLPPAAAEAVRDAIRMPQGLILWSGPVNSGKSTGIAAAVGEHVAEYGDGSKRLSLEDPIERFVYGITQINVPTHISNLAERFNIILRSIKRHDLNVLWVGEVRDKEGAEFCVEFAGSGSLVFSTIHAKDSIVAYEMLAHKVDQSVRYQLAESMALSINQRLVKTLCPHCSSRMPRRAPTPDEVRRFNLNLAVTGETAELPDLLPQVKPGGCPHCDGGYADQVPVCEILPFTREVKNAMIAIAAGENILEHKKTVAAARPMTLLTSGLQLLREGRVDLDTILFY